MYSSDENEFLYSLAVWIFCGLFKKLTFNLSPLESVYFLFFKSSNFIKDLLSWLNVRLESFIFGTDFLATVSSGLFFFSNLTSQLFLRGGSALQCSSFYLSCTV